MTLKSFAAMTVALVSSCSATSSFANHERVDRYPDQSYQSYRPLGFYLGGGYGFGGNEVGRFADSSGEIEKVRGGGGLLLEGGLQLAVDPVTALRLTTGYQADGVSRLNGDSTFSRLRFDLTFIRALGPHEFGAGVTAHTSVGYDCNISSVCAGDVEFDSALGYTLEYAVNLNNGYYRGYRYGKRRGRWNGDMAGLRLGLRFTGIEYTPRLANFEQSDIIDGTTLSAFVGVSF
jgi:hypothetical protein